MGYFAILGMEGADPPEIVRTHINLWSLPSLLPSRRLFYFDVGVEVRAQSDPVTALDLMLPFRVEEGPWPDRSSVVQDLFESLTNPDTAELIFGGPVKHRSEADDHYLEIGDYTGELRVVRVNVATAKKVDSYQPRADSSLYRLELASPIQPGEQGYFRVRWRVFGAHPLWRWKRVSGGARVDLRIADVRESRHAATERALRARILDIGQANVFLMASPNLQLISQSPDFRYLRILEPGAWKSYLQGADHVGGASGLLVYYWRYPQAPLPAAGQTTTASAKPLNMDNPFRVFLDFNRAASATWWVQILRVVVGVGLALALLKGANAWRSLELDYTSVPWGKILTVLGLGSVLAVVSFMGKIRAAVANRFIGPRSWIRRAERRLLRRG